MGVDCRCWICPLRGHLKGRMQYALTLPADGTRWPIKWFPTEADERQAHVLENISGANERQRPLSDIRVGAYCIRPPCSWPRTIAPDRYPPQSENISGANERQRPLSDTRVGAQKHTPPCSWPRTIAPIGHPPPSETISGANERHRPLSDVRVGAQKHTPPMFPVGNNSARQAYAAIGFHFIGG